MQGPDELVGTLEDEPRLLGGFMVTHLSLDELEKEQLVEGEAAASSLNGTQRGWSVERRKSLTEFRQRESAPFRRGEILLPRHLCQEHVEILLEQPSQDPLRDLLARRIRSEDMALGHLSRSVVGGASQHREFSRLKLPSVEELHGPRHQQEIALLKLPLQPGLPRPGARDHPRIILQDGLKYTEPLTGGDHTLGAYPPDRRDVRTDLQVLHRLDRGGVVVASRHMVEEIAGSHDSHSPQRLGPNRTHPVQKLDRLVQPEKVHSSKTPSTKSSGSKSDRSSIPSPDPTSLTGRSNSC